MFVGAVGIHQVDVEDPVSHALEGDVRVIRRPARVYLRAGERGEARAAGPGRAHAPDVAPAVGRRSREHDPIGPEGGERLGPGFDRRELGRRSGLGSERVAGPLAAGQRCRDREEEEAAVRPGETPQGGDLVDGSGGGTGAAGGRGHRDLLGPWSR